MIKVYQIVDQTPLHPAVTFTYGMKISSAFKPEDHMEKYEHVATLDVQTLNEAYEVGNIGPEEKISRFSSMHSLSIGDILEWNDERYIISRLGFDKLEAA